MESCLFIFEFGPKFKLKQKMKFDLQFELSVGP